MEMKKIVIVEDEAMAATALQDLLVQIDNSITILAVLQSIDEATDWFSTHPMPDLVFMDIHLADGLSFAIFESTAITCPVIFTTAYDQYAIRAFDVNSIGYLLKPITKGALEKAWNKFVSSRKDEPSSSPQASTLSPELLSTLLHAVRGAAGYKRNFLIAERDKLIPLSTDRIACFYAELKMVRVITLEGKSHAVDMTLEELTEQLDPIQFFRVNRQYIVSRTAVHDISVWFGQKLSLSLVVSTPERIVVPRARATEFKQWIGQ